MHLVKKWNDWTYKQDQHDSIELRKTVDKGKIIIVIEMIYEGKDVHLTCQPDENSNFTFFHITDDTDSLITPNAKGKGSGKYEKAHASCYFQVKYNGEKIEIDHSDYAYDHNSKKMEKKISGTINSGLRNAVIKTMKRFLKWAGE
jgi:hypothetical protein